MTERALARAYGAEPETAGVFANRRARADILLAAFAILFAGCLAPLLYGFAVAQTYGVPLREALQGELIVNIAFNSAANLGVILLSIGLEGRFDRKLASVLSRTLLIHGTLALFVLVTRQFHSNQIMLMAAGVSAIVGAAVMFARHRVVRPRAAAIGTWHPLIEQVSIDVDWVESPSSNLGEYDMLLTGSVTDLSPEWAVALSRAMLMGKPVRHLAEFVEEDQGRVCIEHFELDHITPRGLTSYRTRKRLIDIALVLVTLPIVLVILLIGSLVVFITMGRPILFMQERVGLGGKAFRMYKLRTMRNAPTPLGKAQATASASDNRITPAGRLLRRFRIDELPQLWHVLKGDMSVVGPRPEWIRLSEEYSQALPAYTYRHLVRPGITGWAQVRGGYAADLAETRTKLAYDLFYLKNLSFALDMHILVRTVWTLLTGSGAR